MHLKGGQRACTKGGNDSIGINKAGTVDPGFVKLTGDKRVARFLHSGRQPFAFRRRSGRLCLEFWDGRRAYFAGDTAVCCGMKRYADLYRPELAFLPVRGEARPTATAVVQADTDQGPADCRSVSVGVTA